MSSKFILTLLSLFIVSCGVKGDPIAPKSSETPSILNNYPDIELPDELREHKNR